MDFRMAGTLVMIVVIGGFMGLLNTSLTNQLRGDGGNAAPVTFHLPTKGVSPAVAQINGRLMQTCGWTWRNRPAHENKRNASGDWQEVDQATGEVRHGIRSARKFLTCLLVNERQRFCDPAEHKRMVAAVTAYTKAVKSTLGGGDPFLKYPRRKSILEGTIERDSDVITGTVPTLNDSELTQAVIRLAQDGHVTRRDFGSVLPTQFEVHLLENPIKACRK
jgi:hypothetical protein